MVTREAEFAGPAWMFGSRSYQVLPDARSAHLHSWKLVGGWAGGVAGWWEVWQAGGQDECGGKGRGDCEWGKRGLAGVGVSGGGGGGVAGWREGDGSCYSCCSSSHSPVYMQHVIKLNSTLSLCLQLLDCAPMSPNVESA